MSGTATVAQDRPKRARWLVDLGANDARIFLWEDAGGRVNLDNVEIDLVVEWDGGFFSMTLGDEASGMWRLDQNDPTTRGMFAVRLPRAYREKLPRGWHASWTIWTTPRFGQRSKRFGSGWMYPVGGAGSRV
jgi:hypothetical protein